MKRIESEMRIEEIFCMSDLMESSRWRDARLKSTTLDFSAHVNISKNYFKKTFFIQFTNF